MGEIILTKNVESFMVLNPANKLSWGDPPCGSQLLRHFYLLFFLVAGCCYLGSKSGAGEAWGLGIVGRREKKGELRYHKKSSHRPRNEYRNQIAGSQTTGKKRNGGWEKSASKCWFVLRQMAA